jgi:hypothetical protein
VIEALAGTLGLAVNASRFALPERSGRQTALLQEGDDPMG